MKKKTEDEEGSKEGPEKSYEEILEKTLLLASY